MTKTIGLRREDKNIWEKRVALIPDHIKQLKNDFGIETVVQPFAERAFSDQEFADAGATINEDLSECPIIIAVKEVPIKKLYADKTYLFFSHTIKGQAYNMPLLQKNLDLKCTLIDYELIRNDQGQRLVFFGKFAGLAGMIDGLNGLGRRLKYLGYETPFLNIKQAYQYKDLDEAKDEISRAGKEIKEKGLPVGLDPLTFGFTGYGNVSQGAQEIFDLLPYEEITPDELKTLPSSNNKVLYKTIFKEVDMFEPKEASANFELHDYFKNPEKYKSKFDQYLGHLDVMVNAIYWHDKCPRLVTKDYVKANFDNLKLKLVTDITCDIDGAVEFTVKATEPDNPAFVYNPKDDTITDGYEGEGIADLTIDNLPTELPRNASIAFSNSLYPFVKGIVEAEMPDNFEDCTFPEEIKRAVIVYKGELTPEFSYLKNYL